MHNISDMILNELLLYTPPPTPKLQTRNSVYKVLVVIVNIIFIKYKVFVLF